MSWEYVRLKEIATIIMGQSPKSEYFNSEGEGMPFMQGKTEFGEFSPSIVKYTTKTTRVAKNNSILFTVRAPVGALNIANQDICIGRGLASIDSNDGDNYFLYYLIKNHHSLFLSESGEGVYDSINKTNLNNVKLFIPSNIDLRKKIGAILGAYDDLIENNLKRIKLLEQAAQNIYKEWFVNLRFPGHENTPINEETGLPLGWEVCTINDVCEKVASGGTPSRRNKSYWDNPKYPWVTTKELRDGFILDVKESVSEEGLKNSSAKLFPKGTILMAIYASPTLGRLGILSREACCNQAAVGFICDNTKISNQFLYYTLYSERANLNAIAIGAAQQNINVGKVKAHEIILPPFHFVERFTSITSSNYEMRLNLVTQNQKLKAARDILLPRLMNRTIEV